MRREPQSAPPRPGDGWVGRKVYVAKVGEEWWESSNDWQWWESSNPYPSPGLQRARSGRHIFSEWLQPCELTPERLAHGCALFDSHGVADMLTFTEAADIGAELRRLPAPVLICSYGLSPARQNVDPEESRYHFVRTTEEQTFTKEPAWNHDQVDIWHAEGLPEGFDF